MGNDQNPMATAKQVVDLIERLDTSKERFQRLIDNTRLLRQIADDKLAPGEIAMLLRERHLTPEQYIGRPLEHVRDLADVGIELKHLLAKTDGDGGVHYLPVANVYDDGEITRLEDLEPYRVRDQHRWAIRMPAAY